ncbi:hypothetical protein [Mesoflavibacter zeaxanthinifaciens]|uniref:hypothetical protein n=1 Tax=Mesoflavibacter zeaxanthinifaciens TaxID=393060 RepID=UPI00040D2EAF|nr:hypothetical protein [Mesoflavibacter zeaxanthinifaciens]
MSKLQIQYSKELAKELGKIAVYLPGEKVNVGDIIAFPFGKSFLGKPRPLGTFKKITSLQKLNVKYTEPLFSNQPDTYQFSSKNAVDFNFSIGANADLGNDDLPKGNAKMKISFTSEGAIYFLAVDCDKKQLDDLSALENEINAKGKKMLWKDTFLVTSVTVAKKAFIAQSRSKTSELLIDGNIQGLKSNTAKIDAETKLKINKQEGDIFIKDWSNNVTVFIDLVRFEEEVFSENYRGDKAISNEKFEESRISFKPVLIEDLLTD